MRIVFIGAVKFSFSALQQLVEMSADIVGVCTMKYSAFNTDHSDLSTYGSGNGIPWMHIDNINSADSVVWIQSLKPDVIFCFGWSQILKEEILGIAPLGTVGFHPSALPKNRGRHPIIWALVLGLKETASTFFFMDSGTDSGDIISQVEIMIASNEDAGSLYEKVTRSAPGQIKEFVPEIGSGSIKRRRQEEAYANVWRKRGITDGLIDWRMSAQSIHNLVRGFSAPYVGAHFVDDGKEIKVWETTLSKDFRTNIEPGKVLLITEMGPIVKCGEGAICLLNTDPDFKPIEGAYL